MPLINWNDETLSLGIEFIDSQHKVLVGYINELDELIKKNENKEDVSIIFNKLVDYTQYHFSSEELYFEGLNANDLTLHKLQHKHFIEQLNLFKDETTENISKDLLHFLLDWLVTHIQCEDKKYIQANLY